METGAEAPNVLTLALLIGCPEHQFISRTKPNEANGGNLDLYFLDELLQQLSTRCGPIPAKAVRNIYKFDVLVAECNAIVVQNGLDCEIGFFFGLKDCILNTTNLISSFGGFMTDVFGASFDEPPSFNNPLPGFEVFFQFSDRPRFHAPDNLAPNQNYDLPQDPYRVGCAHYLRTSAEQLVWLHEHAHIYRGHLLLLQTIGAKVSSLAEGPTLHRSHTENSSHLLIQRALEHDADWHALLTLIEHAKLGSDSEQKYEACLTMLYVVQEMLFSMFWISEIISGLGIKKTHPHPIARGMAIGRKVQQRFGRGSPELRMFMRGVSEWEKVSAWLGWNGSIKKHAPITIDLQDIKAYLTQIDELLEPLYLATDTYRDP